MDRIPPLPPPHTAARLEPSPRAMQEVARRRQAGLPGQHPEGLSPALSVLSEPLRQL